MEISCFYTILCRIFEIENLPFLDKVSHLKGKIFPKPISLVGNTVFLLGRSKKGRGKISKTLRRSEANMSFMFKIKQIKNLFC